MKNWIDLHMHSAMSSDGEYTPKELMKLCKDNGLKVVSIADHNTTKAISKASQYAKEYDLTLIPAIELDCTIDGTELHLLGYGISYDFPAFEEIEKTLEIQEKASSIKRIQLVQHMGIEVDEKKAYALFHNGYVTGEVIAEVALADERNKDILADYLPGGNRSDNPYVNFYWDICSQGKPAYVPIHYITLEEAVTVINDAGGIAVLAHPGNNVKEDEKLLEKIFTYDVKGIEVFSSYHSTKQVDYYLKWAKDHNVLPTIGSDFHGKTKPSIKLGALQNEEQEAIYTHLKKLLASI